MPITQYDHMAVNLNGKIVLCGGHYGFTQSNFLRQYRPLFRFFSTFTTQGHAIDDYFIKMGHSRPLFLYFRLFNTVDSKQINV